MALLETNDLSKRFGGLTAVEGVSLAVASGEIRGVIGPNGAGKTTLLNLIGGLYPPSEGEIRLDGQPLAGLAPHQIARKGLIRSFQVARLFGNMSVLDNLMLPWLADRQAGGVAGAAEQAARLLELTRLAPLAQTPAKALSGGQRALLQIAAGFMAPRLKCYLLDEPFAGVNPAIKDSIVDLIERDNRDRSTTFVIVSHEMTIVRRLCRRVTVMIEGRIGAEGTLDEVAGDDAVIGAYLGRSSSP
jgi:ABC-type branched-subunit amino acid transport system ATPase component